MPIPSRLAEAKQLAVYWDNYVNYLSTVDDRQPNVGQGTPKPPQIALFIKPFAFDLATDQFIEANGTASRWATWETAFTNYTKASLGSSETALGIKLSPARVVIKQGMSTTKQVQTAKTTKRKYITYGGTNGSVPFGLQTGTDNELTLFNTIRTNIKGLTAFDSSTMRVSRIKEKA